MDDWTVRYVDAIETVANNWMSKLGITGFILTAAHDGITEEMEKRNIPYLSVFPTLESGNTVLNSLKQRYTLNPTEKNDRALTWMRKNFSQIIIKRYQELDMNPHRVDIPISIDSGYYMESVIKELLEIIVSDVDLTVWRNRFVTVNELYTMHGIKEISTAKNAEDE